MFSNHTGLKRASERVLKLVTHRKGAKKDEVDEKEEAEGGREI